MLNKLIQQLKKKDIKVVKTPNKEEIAFSLNYFNVMIGVISTEICEAYVEVTDTRTDNVLSDTVISTDEEFLSDIISVVKSLSFELNDEYETEKTLELESYNEKEDFGNDIESVIRALISDEQDASSSYLAAIEIYLNLYMSI